MILLIDNYDSFVYNLYQLIGSFHPDIRVVRNREITLAEIQEMNPEAVFLSPGPGRPEDSGVCLDVIQRLHKPISWDGAILRRPISLPCRPGTAAAGLSAGRCTYRGRRGHGSGA